MAVGQACPQGTTSLSRSQSALMPTTMVMTRMKVSVMTLSWGCCGQWSQALGLCATLKTHTRANCVEVFQDYQTTMQRIVRWGTHELINTTMLWPYSRWGAPVGPHMRPNRAVLALLTAPYPLSMSKVAYWDICPQKVSTWLGAKNLQKNIHEQLRIRKEGGLAYNCFNRWCFIDHLSLPKMNEWIFSSTKPSKFV